MEAGKWFFEMLFGDEENRGVGRQRWKKRGGRDFLLLSSGDGGGYIRSSPLGRAIVFYSCLNSWRLL